MEYQVLIPQATLSPFREEPEPCRALEGFWVGVNSWMKMGLMAEQLVIPAGIPAPCTCQGVAGGNGWKLGQGQQWSWLL